MQKSDQPRQNDNEADVDQPQLSRPPSRQSHRRQIDLDDSIHEVFISDIPIEESKIQIQELSDANETSTFVAENGGDEDVKELNDTIDAIIEPSFLIE